MPNRLLREGILTSEAVNSLSWAEEVFYRRLMSVIDDFGRYYATPKLLRAACYPLHIDKVSDPDIGKWLSACETAALVRVYPASDGKRYLELLNFRQQVRAKVSRFPAFDVRLLCACTADAKQVRADAHLDVVGDVDVGEGSSEPLTGSEPTSEFSIPLNDGSEWAVTARTLVEWVQSFPAVDVEQELREMRAWSLANKAKRKTRRGVEAFAVRWLAKAQDTPGRASQRQPGSDDWTRTAA